MKTYPIFRKDGSLNGFEISNTWISLPALRKLLLSIEGVSDVKFCKNKDERIEFVFNSEICVVYEPFGDNSRYWIGSKDPANSRINIEPIQMAMMNYQHSIVILFNKIIYKFKR